MRRELIEAINIQAKRDGFYLPIIKAVVFEELSKKYNSKPLSKILNSSKGGSWGEDFINGGLEAISLRSPDIRHGFIDFENGEKRFYEKSTFSKYRLDDGDILVIKSNGSLDLVGKSQVYFSNPKYPNVTASNFLMILKPNKDLVSPLYLDIFLKSPQSLIWRVEKQRTTTGLRNLDSKGYLSLEIPLPETLDEQELVAEIINKLTIHEFPKNEIFNISTIELASKISERFNELLDEYERNENLLVELKQSILQEAIQGKLTADWREQNPNTETASELLKRIKAEKAQLIKDKKIKKEKALPPITEDEIPFELPEGWVWCRLGDICSKTGSGSTPKGGKSAYPSSGIKFLRSQNVYDDGLRYDGLVFISDKTHEKMSGTKVQAEDLLLNITGGSIGRCCIVPKDFDTGNINQHVAIIRSVISENGYYLHKIICSPYFQNMIIEVQTGAGREGLPKNKMDNILIPFPPFEEQKEIVRKVETLMQKCQALEQEIKTSEANAQMLMQAVLKEAFEGKQEVVEV